MTVRLLVAVPGSGKPPEKIREDVYIGLDALAATDEDFAHLEGVQVSVLRSPGQVRESLEAARAVLERIATTDFRGPEPYERNIARRWLEANPL